MQPTNNHNKDYNTSVGTRPTSSLPAILKDVPYWYWLLPILALSAYILYATTGDNPVAVNEYVQKVEELETTPVITTNESNNSQAKAPSADSTQLPDTVALQDDQLTHSNSGESFKSLLEASPANWNSSTVRKGDTLFIILKRLGLNVAAATLVANSENSRQLVRLIPGRTLHILSKDGASSDAFIYENSLLTWVYAQKNGSNYDISSKKLPTTTHIRKAKGVVVSSLYAAAKVSGINDTLAMNMTEIFGWDIDFAINVQPGDRFKLIYEDVYVNGSRKTHGDILAAEFVNNGKIFRAIAQKDEDGTLRYYSPDGKSMQKTFLRSPVKFSRISSRFSKARYHPVLKKTRAHKGVDYAAGRGTPIRSTANGRVIYAGRRGGYGNAIIINHGSTYSTLYAHMSRFSRGIKKGSKIRQGQVIGRVGSTGLASGPHLHYEFRINGKHVNPLTFRQPASKPIQQSMKAEFGRSAEYWEEQLDSLETLNITASLAQSDS